MIKEMRLRDFKNFRDATLRLGPFTILTGLNGSGKSNIRDAFRFLHGVGRGYSLPDIIGGKYGAGGQLEWAQLRGAATEIVRFGRDGFAIDVTVSPPRGLSARQDTPSAHYHIKAAVPGLGSGEFRMLSEALDVDGRSLFHGNPERKDFQTWQVSIDTAGTEKEDIAFNTAIDHPALDKISTTQNMEPDCRQGSARVREAFGDIRFLDVIPDRMRTGAFPGQTVMGDGGENLSAILYEICRFPDRKAIFIDWIQELTPMDVVDFEFPSDPSGLIHLAMKERRGAIVSARSASDGTLRFLAFLAALLGKNPAKLYFFEEIETGIHPSRLKLLLDLIEHQTAKNDIQVISTTHSPALLSMIGDSTFASTSVVFRPPDADHALIRPISEMPKAAALRTSQGLGRLHQSGWLEDVLTFEAEDEAAPAK